LIITIESQKRNQTKIKFNIKIIYNIIQSVKLLEDIVPPMSSCKKFARCIGNIVTLAHRWFVPIT